MKLNKQKIAPYMFIFPFFLSFFIFGIFSIGYSVYISFFKWTMGGAENFLGLGNYARFLTKDPFFFKSVWNTVLLLIMGSLPQHLFALPIAILLNQRFIKGQEVFKTGYFLPYITSSVSVSIIFANLFDDKFGWINYALIHFFNFEEGVNWGTAFNTKLMLSVVINWRNIGFYVVIYMAGLSTIDKSIYASAKLDGANTWQQTIYITIPMIMPVIFFALSITVIFGMQLFEEPYVMCGGYNQLGGVDNTGMTTTYYMMFLGFRLGRFGRASAVSWLMFFVIMILTFGLRFLTNKFDYTKEKKFKETKKKSIA